MCLHVYLFVGTAAIAARRRKVYLFWSLRASLAGNFRFYTVQEDKLMVNTHLTDLGKVLNS